eukprot:c21914_g2_i4.p1 GENE.c21914_g2_i4~~c21914_g2_i4.p1  ORF type:complete len:215 (+),score=86.96 c21914_g2_i4:33-647(+)
MSNNKTKYSKVGEELDIVGKHENINTEELEQKFEELVSQSVQTHKLMRQAIIVFSIILLVLAICFGYFVSNQIKSNNLNDSTKTLLKQISISSSPTHSKIPESPSSSPTPKVSPSSVASQSPATTPEPTPPSTPASTPEVSPNSTPSTQEPDPSPSYTPAPSQEVIAVIYDGKVWWDGKYDTFPEPITTEFSGPHLLLFVIILV